jgi:general secretion pathway protein K
VLPIVLFFTLLLYASIATFLKRATVDAMLSRNRDAMASTEALARGGVELAKALLIEDRASEALGGGGARIDSHLDRWSLVSQAVIEAPGGASLRLHIEDTGALLNLNAVFALDESGQPSDRAEPFLQAFLEKMIEETPIDVQALYDPRELAENLIDYVDPDDVRLGGGFEDDYYQQQNPKYRTPGRPLLSVDELGLVEGFDATLVEVVRPYITVYPYAGGTGVNPNTAPAHVLALIFYNDGVDLRLAQEDDIRRILDARESGDVLCDQQGQSESCIPIGEIFPNATSIFPPLGFFSDTFAIRSEAAMGEVHRTVEAVIDRTTLTDPLVLSWKVR